MYRVGQDRIHTTYMTVYLVISLPNIPYIHRIYIYMVLANPMYVAMCGIGQPKSYGNLPAKNTGHTPYIHTYVL